MYTVVHTLALLDALPISSGFWVAWQKPSGTPDQVRGDEDLRGSGRDRLERLQPHRRETLQLGSGLAAALRQVTHRQLGERGLGARGVEHRAVDRRNPRRELRRLRFELLRRLAQRRLRLARLRGFLPRGFRVLRSEEHTS